MLAIVRERLRSLCRSMFSMMGYDLLAVSSRANLPRRRVRLLKQYDVDLVLDVGAADGGYARSLREAGYTGPIHCFEPLPISRRGLEAWARKDAGVTIHAFALGEVDGLAPLQIAGNRDSSSLREMLPAHMEAAPYANPVGYETVTVRRLDEILPGISARAKHPFLKMDTQGFELDVLRGAGAHLHEIVGVQAELSLVALYQDQPLWLEVIDFLETRGLHLCSLEPGFCDDRNGRLLQVDGLFFRTG